MYAIIRTGGKQYRVEPGEKLRVEKLDQKLGASFDITDVLFVGGETAHVGMPTVAGAKVSVVVTQHSKYPKILVFKKKRRKGYRKLKGHRQPFTELFVSSITSPTQTKKAENKPQVVDRAASAEKKTAIVKKLAEAGKKPVVKKAAKAKTAQPKAAKKKPAAKKSGAKKKTSKPKAKKK